ncbi:TPA: hypothetical protein QCU24_003515 [Bacillus cereus]|nr:hypothetical protein [Bacillus cereus]
MKYKDRKSAKRKYKQALLATVATMTLGVSALGGTAHAFAAEEDNISVISSRTINNIGTQTSKEEKDTSFVKKVLFEYDNKTGKKFAATTMKELITIAKSDNADLNNFFRAVVIAGTDFMPYGMFVSPLISLLWPENKADDLGKLKQELQKYVVDQIDDEQLKYLNGEFRSLAKDLITLANAVNEPNSEHADDKTKNQLGSWAVGIEQAFGRILEHTSDAGHKETNLPLYTKVAIAHIQFLKSIQTHSAKMNITNESLQQLYTKQGVNTLVNSYVEHIMQTYDHSKDQYIEKISNVPSFKLKLDDEKNQVKDLENRRNEAKNEVSNLEKAMLLPGRSAARNAELKEAKDKLQVLTNAVQSYNSLSKLYKLTLGDPTIQDLATGTWVQKSGKWHFIDKHKKDVTGWILHGNTKYYLSPTNGTKNSAGETFKQGEMITGKIEIDNETYYFKPETGEMAIGLTTIGNTKYYFSPVYNMKNHDSKTFNKGQMMTGWVQFKNIDEKTKDYYYFSPNDDTTNDYQKGKTFKKGEMWTGWLQDHNKWYYMNKGERSGRDIGIMLHDENIDLDNGKGVKKWYKFNYEGVCTNI